VKVGGHQASSASLVSIMTSLWFRHLRPADRVSVKPHASPVLHAINYLLGELDPAYLTTLREFAGPQSYPSRAKDPDPVDYSTGSVGIGATAFALDFEWVLLACLALLGRPGGSSAYLRLSTRPVDQTLALVPSDPAARERRRRQVVTGGYLLRRAGSAVPDVTIAAMGVLVPEALAAASRLTDSGVLRTWCA